MASPARRGTYLAVLIDDQPQQVVSVSVLLVIVNQSDVGRARDYAVRFLGLDYAAVSVTHNDLGVSPHLHEGPHPPDGVHRVPREELERLLSRVAYPRVLVAPVRFPLGMLGKVQVVMRDQPRRTRRTSKNDFQQVPILVIPRLDEATVSQQLQQRLGSVPLSKVLVVRRRRVEVGRRVIPQAQLTSGTGQSARLLQDVVGLPLHLLQVVAGRFHPTKKDVERGNVVANRINAQFVSLYQRRAGAHERVEYRIPRRKVLPQEYLHQLRDEFSQIRMQAMHVLGALPLGEVPFRPVQVQLVEWRVRRHAARRRGRAVPRVSRHAGLLVRQRNRSLGR